MKVVSLRIKTTKNIINLLTETYFYQNCFQIDHNIKKQTSCCGEG